jgi:hypothetical protein
VRNRIRVGDRIEHLPRRGHPRTVGIEAILNMGGERIDVAQPGSEALLGVNLPACRPNEILRRVEVEA